MRRRRIPAIAATLALFAAPSLLASQDSVERALGWIPEDSVSFILVPELKRASDDIAALVEATGQGGMLSLGRPIDVLKAQLGIGANLDERAPIVAYYPPRALRGAKAAEGAAAGGDAAAGAGAAAPATPELPVVVVGVTDADAFLSANLTAVPEAGDDAYRTSNGVTLFARRLDGRVALAPRRESLPAADARGIGERFRARLEAAESEWLARADLVAWGSRDALREAVESARALDLAAMRDAMDAEGLAPAEGAPAGGVAGGANAAQVERFREKSLEILDMLADGMVVVDADPLGLFVAALGVAEPDSTLAKITAGGEGRAARFDRLPKNPFYFAFAAALDGLGGAAKLGELLDFGGVERNLLPEWVFTEGADLRTVQLAAYPSKLGVAIGGALNDSALVLGSRNPARTLARIKSTIESSRGESAGVRREPAWEDARTLKSGEVAAAFEVKETVFDASQRPALDIERVSRQFIFGSRGIHGLARQTSDSVVVTFSQRPDVLGRALESAQGPNSLASDPVVESIEEWLPADRDVEAMIGVGRVVNLGSQIASSFVSAEEVRALVPEIEADAEPVAFALSVDEGRVRTVVVVPAAVLRIAAGFGTRAAGGAGR